MLKEIFTTEGRLNRLPYLKYMAILFVASCIVNVLVPFVAALLTGDAEGFLAMTLTFFVSLPLSIGSFMVGIRRLHDLNRTGWFMLLVFIPIVNLLFAIYLLFFKGTEGYNNYGADPLQF